MKRDKKKLLKIILTGLFLITETVLFGVIIRHEFLNEYLAPVRYGTVVLCGIAALLILVCERQREGLFLFIAMLFTAGADWFLVVKDESYALAIGLFFGAQVFHFLRLSAAREKGKVISLLIRLLLSLLFAEGVSLVLSEKLLSIIQGENIIVLLGGLYFIELLMNTVDAGILIKRDRRFVMTMVGFILFILCDISVGLNGMSGAWGISRETANFAADMIWVWYLPSQVLIVLSAMRPFPPSHIFFKDDVKPSLSGGAADAAIHCLPETPDV